jgi:O-antigen/teichoic acid export membrane protein
MASVARSSTGGGARHLKRARRLSWAITDQALFAGSNFVLGVLTARWMEPQEYGAFATALAVYILLMSLYEAMLTDPMMVFGASRFAARFRRYMGALIAGHFPLAALSSAFLLLAGMQLDAMNQPELSAATFALAATIPIILLRPLFRQACYAHNRARLATWGGLIYALTLGAGLLVLQAYLDFTYFQVFAVMAVATLACSIFVGWNLGPQVPDRDFALEVTRRHWDFGKWSLGSHVVRWVPGNIWYFVLPLWVTLEHNAAFRALLNLNLIITHVMTATAVLLLPALVRALASSEAHFQRVSRDATILFVTLGLGYWVVVSAFGAPLVSWLYDGKYVQQTGLLLLLGLTPLAGGIRAVCGSRARAAERPDIIFKTSFISLPVMIPGLALAYWYGLTGVAVGYLLVQVVGAAVMVYRTFGHISRWAGRAAKSSAQKDELILADR